MTEPLRVLADFLAESAAAIHDMCDDSNRTPEGIRALIARRANAPMAELGNRSVVDVLAVKLTDPSSVPPTTPPSLRRSLGSSAPPLTQPSPRWQAKSRSLLLKSMAPGPPLRWPL